MSKRFTVTEECNGYYLFDKITEMTACMGDGVDIEGFVGGFAEVGEPGFAEEWENDANSDVETYMEAYFPDLYNLVIYDSPDFADRYTVLVRLVSEEEQAVLTRRWHMGETWVALSMGSSPDHPQYGFSQWCHADAEHMEQIYRHISFSDLPQNVQRHIAKRLED